MEKYLAGIASIAAGLLLILASLIISVLLDLWKAGPNNLHNWFKE